MLCVKEGFKPGLPTVSYTHLDVYKRQAYTLGLSMLQSLLCELGKATKHIHMEFYIFEDDAIGRLVRDLSLIHICTRSWDGK